MKFDAGLQRRQAQFAVFLGRQVDDDQAVDAGGSASFRNLSTP